MGHLNLGVPPSPAPIFGGFSEPFGLAFVFVVLCGAILENLFFSPLFFIRNLLSAIQVDLDGDHEVVDQLGGFILSLQHQVAVDVHADAR